MTSYKAQVTQWIKQNNPQAAEFDEDTHLLEKKILTSVQIMDLVLFLEHLQGKPLEIDQIQPENFRTVNRIVTAFFKDEAS